MDVTPVGTRKWNAAQPTAQNGHASIEQRIGQCENRDESVSHVMPIRRALDGEYGEEKANHETPGIAHEQSRRWPVVPQESKQRAAKRDGVDRHASVAEHESRRGGRQQRDERYATGETVEAIDEIERVRDSDEPEHGKGQREDTEMNSVSRQQADVLDAESGAINDQSRSGLTKKLEKRTDAAQVVEQSNEKEQRRGNDERAGKLGKVRNRFARGSCL